MNCWLFHYLSQGPCNQHVMIFRVCLSLLQVRLGRIFWTYPAELTVMINIPTVLATDRVVTKIAWVLEALDLDSRAVSQIECILKALASNTLHELCRLRPEIEELVLLTLCSSHRLCPERAELLLILHKYHRLCPQITQLSLLHCSEQNPAGISLRQQTYPSHCLSPAGFRLR